MNGNGVRASSDCHVDEETEAKSSATTEIEGVACMGVRVKSSQGRRFRRGEP